MPDLDKTPNAKRPKKKDKQKATYDKYGKYTGKAVRSKEARMSTVESKMIVKNDKKV